MFCCVCYQVPDQGDFSIGKSYSFTYMIDAEQIQDDSGETVILSEDIFFSHFIKTKVATSHCPMLYDNTIYYLYFVLANEQCSIEEIRACAKILNVNYLQARKALSQKRSLIEKGKAYKIQAILEKLDSFQIQYEIEPQYPY